MHKMLSVLALAGSSLTATATGIPVIDVTAVGNLIQQVAYWQQQIAAMANQLQQLQQTHAAMSGTRGMQTLLPTTDLQRNYLPRDYAELIRTLDGHSATYAGLSEKTREAMVANAVLTPNQLSALSADQRRIIENRRRSTAMLSAFTQSAYQNTSQRFTALQSLVAMIGTAADQKAILDLQGRINAEQALLTNEQTKLQTLHQVLQAEQAMDNQRVREQVIAGHGRFRNRFAPTLPGAAQQ